MADNQVDFRIVFDRFPEIARRAPEAAKEAVQKAALEIEARAKEIVPVDTGTLRNSIRSSTMNDGMTGVVSTAVEYAAYVEYGTRFSRAQPYLGPSVEKVRPSFLATMEKLCEGE